MNWRCGTAAAACRTNYRSDCLTHWFPCAKSGAQGPTWGWGCISSGWLQWRMMGQCQRAEICRMVQGVEFRLNLPL